MIKKIICGLICTSLIAAQPVLANTLATGNFAGANVLNPSNGIGGAQISGHTSGLTNVTTDGKNATLNFNNDTRIDWSNLNVGGNQTLNFQNGNNVVLNNVLNGMSTFAGKVTGEKGAIIISNPSGILLQGGKFETAGALTLTTKNLLNQSTFDKNGKISIDMDNAQYNKNEYSIISIGKNGDTKSVINAEGDINIIAKGININNANIAGNGVNLVTSDGVNYFAASKLDQNIFYGNNSIQIADTAIATKNGTLKLLTKNSNINVNNSDINSNMDIVCEGTATKTILSNNSIKGAVNIEDGYFINIDNTSINNGLTINSQHNTTLENTNIEQGLIITSDKQITIKDGCSVVGESILNAGTMNTVFNSSFDGNVTVVAQGNTNGLIFNGNTVKGNVDLTADANISVGGLKAENLTATSNNANITVGGSTKVNTTILTARNGDIKFNYSTSEGDFTATAKSVDTKGSKFKSNKTINIVTDEIVEDEKQEEQEDKNDKEEIIEEANKTTDNTTIVGANIQKDTLPIADYNNNVNAEQNIFEFHPVAFAAHDIETNANINSVIYKNAQNIIIIE